MRFAVDDLGLFLSIAETILLFLGLIFYALATLTICRDKLLHANFRLLLCFILFRSVLIPLRRLPTLYWRVFLIGENTVPFYKISNDMLAVTSNLLCTCLLVLSVERLLQTHVKRCGQSGFIGTAAVLGMLLASNGILFLARKLWPSTEYSIAFLIVAPIVSLILLIWVFRINLRRRNLLDTANLNDKAEASRNMNSVRIFLPAMALSSALTMSVGIVTLVQLLWITQEKVGSPESKLNNMFGLIAAFDSFLTPVLVVVRHKYLKMMYLKRITREIEQKSVTPEDHLKQFNAQWRVAT